MLHISTIIHALSTELHAKVDSTKYITADSLVLDSDNGFIITTISKEARIKHIWLNLGPVQEDIRKNCILVDLAFNDIESADSIINIPTRPVTEEQMLINMESLGSCDDSDVIRCNTEVSIDIALQQLHLGLVGLNYNEGHNVNEVHINGELWIWLNNQCNY